MLATVDGFQVSELVPLDDGSVRTDLFDTAGNVVGSVTRLGDGSGFTADVEPLDSDTGGFDWTATLKKVTDFLDTVADTTRQTADQTTRVSRAIKGAQAGAQAGYSAPLDWKPWAIAGVSLALLLGVAAAAHPSRRR